LTLLRSTTLLPQTAKSGYQMITIANLERNTADDGVIVCHWRANKADGDYTASSYGTVSFTPDPTSPDFTPFADLTEAQVVGWVEAELDMVSLEANLDAQIESQKNPVTVAGTPW